MRKGDAGWRIVVLEWATLCPCLLWPRAKVNTSNSMPQMKHSLFPLIPLLPRPAYVCHAYTRVRLISAALNSERKNFINNARKIVRNCQNNLC